MDRFEEGPPQRELREYISILRYRKWTVLVVWGLVVAATVAFSLTRTPEYTSQSSVLVRPFSVNGIEPVMETERSLVDSAAVASRVRNDLALSDSADSLTSSLEVSIEPETNILDISYTDPDPERARNLAQAFATAYLDFRRDQALKNLEDDVASKEVEITSLRQQIDGINARLAGTTNQKTRANLVRDRDTLLAQLATLQLQEQRLRTDLREGGGEIVDPADLPSAPTSPNHKRNLALGVILGFVVGIGGALLRERLDDRIRSPEDLEEHVRAPVLASIPSVPEWKERSDTEIVALAAPKGRASEAYKTLRTNIQFTTRTSESSVIAVTSPGPGEGKTTTVANLAVTLALAGKRVVAVSCDLRKPRLHRFFGLRNATGVSTILSGQEDAADAILSTEIEGLSILPSGPVPPNPAELLGLPQMDELLGLLRERAEFVVLDSPPVLAVADALVLARKSDGVVLVADATSTARTATIHVRRELDQVGVKVFGAVFNNFDKSQARYDPAYSYYSYEYDEAPASADGDSPPELPERRPPSRAEEKLP